MAPNLPAVLDDPAFERLLRAIHAGTGHDLGNYRRMALEPRVRARMLAARCATFEDYVALVEVEHAELHRMYRSLLLGSTWFFRDGHPYDALRNHLLPRLIQGKSRGHTLSIWVPACSTGEEAYSIAMCLVEALDTRVSEFQVRFVATDMDSASLEFARRGLYPASIRAHVPSDRLRRFFTLTNHGYQVSRTLVDLVSFEFHDATSAPPMRDVDFISCRNLLIYLQASLQRQLLQAFHDCLRPGAFLMLGTSESIGDSSDLFSLLDSKSRIYTCKRSRPS